MGIREAGAGRSALCCLRRAEFARKELMAQCESDRTDLARRIVPRFRQAASSSSYKRISAAQ
jgi:hypothetical protein